MEHFFRFGRGHDLGRVDRHRHSGRAVCAQCDRADPGDRSGCTVGGFCIGAALLLWFYFALLYDALVLFLMFSFADYPLEKAMLAFISLNPIDLARVVVLLQMDISALMGYTGALFREFLGTGWGIGFAVVVLLLWVFVPISVAVRVFRRKDL